MRANKKRKMIFCWPLNRYLGVGITRERGAFTYERAALERTKYIKRRNNVKKRTYVVYCLLWVGCTSAFGLPLDYLVPPIGNENSAVSQQREQIITLVENDNTTHLGLDSESNGVRTLSTVPHETT